MSAVPSGLAPRNDCAEDSARSNRRFLNKEARNRGNGISEIEGKAARLAASESGDEGVSNGELAVGTSS